MSSNVNIFHIVLGWNLSIRDSLLKQIIARFNLNCVDEMLQMFPKVPCDATTCWQVNSS